jgi:hypothetical protein
VAAGTKLRHLSPFNSTSHATGRRVGLSGCGSGRGQTGRHGEQEWMEFVVRSLLHSIRRFTAAIQAIVFDFEMKTAIVTEKFLSG